MVGRLGTCVAELWRAVEVVVDGVDVEYVCLHKCKLGVALRVGRNAVDSLDIVKYEVIKLQGALYHSLILGGVGEPLVAASNH